MAGEAEKKRRGGDRWDKGIKGILSPNRKIFEARKRETAALGAGEKLVLGHPLAATIGDSARCMQNLEKVLIHGAKDLRHGDVYLRLGLVLIHTSPPIPTSPCLYFLQQPGWCPKH